MDFQQFLEQRVFQLHPWEIYMGKILDHMIQSHIVYGGIAVEHTIFKSSQDKMAFEDCIMKYIPKKYRLKWFRNDTELGIIWKKDEPLFHIDEQRLKELDKLIESDSANY